MKKLKIFLTPLILTILFLSSCGLRGIGYKESALLFDKNGNMLCDYYLINLYLNSRQENPDGGYYYAMHKYRDIGTLKGKDLVSYSELLLYNCHVTAIYTSYGPSEKNIYFGNSGTPKNYADALKIIPVEELKNCLGSEYTEKRSFCAEVVSVGKDRLTVKPLDGSAEGYIFDTLTVSRETSGLGITADKLSVGDVIRIFYNSGLWKHGINIRTLYHFELIMSKKDGIDYGFVGLSSYTEERVFENAVYSDNSSVALPVYVISSAAELEAQSAILKDSYYSNFQSLNFSFLTDNYTDEYFDSKSLVLAYLPSPSVSYKYEITNLSVSDEKLTLEITCTNDPQNPYPQTMLYAVFIETEQAVESIDAALKEE